MDRVPPGPKWLFRLNKVREALRSASPKFGIKMLDDLVEEWQRLVIPKPPFEFLPHPVEISCVKFTCPLEAKMLVGFQYHPDHATGSSPKEDRYEWHCSIHHTKMDRHLAIFIAEYESGMYGWRVVKNAKGKSWNLIPVRE